MTQEWAAHHEEAEITKPFPIIAIVGPMGAGKETFANVLHENFGLEIFRTTDVLKSLAKAQDISPPYTRELLSHIHDKLEAEHGPGALAKITYELVVTTSTLKRFEGAVIDGITTQEDAQFIKNLPNSYLVAIDASENLRFNRIVHREREGDYSSLDEFKKKDDLENESIFDIFPSADLIIDNSEELEVFEQRAIEFFIER